VLLGVARCQRLLGDYPKATSLLDQILRDHPKNLDAMRERGKLAREMNEPKEAHRWLLQVVQKAPYDPEAVSLLAECEQQLGRPEEADKYRKKAKEIRDKLETVGELTLKIMASPHDAGLRYEVGKIFLQSGQTTQGLRWLNSALQEDAYHQETNQILADYYESIGEKEVAAELRQRALQAPLMAREPSPSTLQP
jgi:tetratricopeptide (TPR) repeat protein